MKSAVVIGVILCASARLCAEEAVGLDLASVIKHVEQSETAIHNLYIKNFHTTIETRAAGQDQWTQTPMTSEGSAWYDDSPRGRSRIYYSKLVQPWVQGAAPWSGQVDDVSWDGKVGREIHISGGALGNEGADHSAMITADPSPILSAWSRYETGSAYTLQYYVDPGDLSLPPRERCPLSKMLQRTDKKVAPLELSKETVNGVEAVRIRWTYPNNAGSGTFWLDPRRGYSLVREEQILNLQGDKRSQSTDVQELKQIATGVWFPLRATAARYMPGPKGYRRYQFKADDVVANDPNWNNAIFTATIPNGFIVTDTRGGNPRAYVLDDGKELPLVPGQPLPDVPVQEAKRPDAQQR